MGDRDKAQCHATPPMEAKWQICTRLSLFTILGHCKRERKAKSRSDHALPCPSGEYGGGGSVLRPTAGNTRVQRNSPQCVASLDIPGQCCDIPPTKKTSVSVHT